MSMHDRLDFDLVACASIYSDDWQKWLPVADPSLIGDPDLRLFARVGINNGYIKAATSHLPPAHVRSTAKFYEELSKDAPAQHAIKICNGEACRAAGCTGVERDMCAAFDVALGGTNAQGVRIEGLREGSAPHS